MLVEGLIWLLHWHLHALLLLVAPERMIIERFMLARAVALA
jgi:hypothetical protein